MHRILLQSLEKWKDSPARQPLLLRGARQTGKTYLVKQFSDIHFDQLICINFEKSPHFQQCFQTIDATKIIQQIELNTNQTFVPGKSLLFLDEIQECPNAIQSMRYFYEQIPDLHVIGAGSLLEFALSAADFSMPVGRVEFLYLYPMSFSEMLHAFDQNKLIDYLKHIRPGDQIPVSVHQHLLQQLRLYFILGGMPRIVSLYATHQKLLLCRQAQTALLNAYRSDFGKYASRAQQRYCERVFEKSFDLVAKHFKYTDIDPDIDARGLKAAIQLLFKANILTPIYCTRATGLPLSATQIDKKYKLLLLDIGLAQAAGRISPQLLLNQDLMQMNQGMLTEQYVGQHLLTIQPSYDQAALFYWQRDARNSQAEIDYILNIEDQIIPIEVKSGKSGRLKSLHLFMENHQSELGIKLSTDHFDTSQKVWSVPLYLVEQLPRLVRMR